MSKQEIDKAVSDIEDALRIADRRTEIFDNAWNAIAALKEAVKQHDAEPVLLAMNGSTLFVSALIVQHA